VRPIGDTGIGSWQNSQCGSVSLDDFAWSTGAPHVGIWRAPARAARLAERHQVSASLFALDVVLEGAECRAGSSMTILVRRVAL